jgi:glycosyltransferase involved in cell wall biosynthesis
MKIGITGPISTSLFLDTMGLPVRKMPPGLQSANVSNLINGLWSAGHEIVVHTLDTSTGRDLEFFGNRITVCYSNYRKHYRIFDFFRSERHALQRQMKRHPSDILHAHWSYEFALAALHENPNSIVTLHDWAPAILKLMPNYYRLGRLFMHILATRKARYLLTNSEYMRDSMHRLQRKFIAVIPNPLAPPKHSPSKEAGKIIAVNNGFNQMKNVQTLLIAFCEHLAARGNCSLHLIGHGYEPGGQAFNWAKERRLSLDRVHFVGHLKYDLTLQEIATSELLVHPSREESFGNVLAEAMLRKTAVVGGRSSGAVPEVLDHGRAGILVDIDSPGEIAESIRSLMDDRRLLGELQERGCTFATQTFHPDVIAAIHLAVYSEVMSANRSQSSKFISKSACM